MPTSPKRPCRRPGCPRLTDSGWCQEHRRERPPDQKPWGTTTTSANARGYGSSWRKLRAAVLRRDTLCTSCWREPATEVDHLVPKSKGGPDTMDNLRGTCGACHGRKTAREGIAARRSGRGRGGGGGGVS